MAASAVSVEGVNSAMQIIAHRGASKQRPEHTVPAYELAAAQGADGFECDIRLTRDGHAVCVHDRTVDRVSDGSGAVSSLSLADLRSLNFGTPTRPESVLTLAELLEFVQDQRHSVGVDRAELFIETKQPAWRGWLLEAEMHRQLEAAGLGHGQGVYTISFDSFSLWRSKRINPRVGRVQLRRKYHPENRPLVDRWGIADAHGWSVEKAVEKAVGKSLAQRGSAGAGASGARNGATGTHGDPGVLKEGEHWPRPQYLWTADRREEVEWAVAHKVRWLATNYPQAARGWAGR